MQKNKITEDQSQRGNTFMIVVLVIAILGLFMFNQSKPNKESAAQKDRDLVSASQVIQFPAAVQDTIEQMMENGVSPMALNFTDEPTNEDKTEVFGLAGGKLEFRDPPRPMRPEEKWKFKALNDEERGYFVKDVGTNDAVSGREILAYLEDVPLGVCEMLRRGLEQEAIPTEEKVRVDFKLNDGAGDKTEAGENAVTFDSMPGALFSCVENGRDQYVYYHVLTTQLNWNEEQE